MPKYYLAKWWRTKRTQPRERRDMTESEIKRFFAAEDQPLYRLLWLVYFHTGLRAQAGLSLEWEWIHWETRIMKLPNG